MEADLNPIDSLLVQPLESCAQAVLEETLKAFACSTGTIHVWNAETQLLELMAQQGIPEFLLEKVSKIPMGKGIAGAAAQQGDAVQICNLQTDDSGVAKPDAKHTNVAGSVAVPIQRGGELLGTLGIGKFEPYDFSDAEIAQLNQVAELIAANLQQ
ncbi:GAF domain-containing protein [Rubritalea marina]|uniref:GAF domain-containing protein n=1 Tax=Rubritalea marina TaxID=361055 RepID=UPI00036BB6FC|nr:GAF domain-containing protein [Rubritalea marina]